MAAAFPGSVLGCGHGCGFSMFSPRLWMAAALCKTEHDASSFTSFLSSSLPPYFSVSHTATTSSFDSHTPLILILAALLHKVTPSDCGRRKKRNIGEGEPTSSGSHSGCGRKRKIGEGEPTSLGSHSGCGRKRKIGEGEPTSLGRGRWRPSGDSSGSSQPPTSSHQLLSCGSFE